MITKFEKLIVKAKKWWHCDYTCDAINFPAKLSWILAILVHEMHEYNLCSSDPVLVITYSFLISSMICCDLHWCAIGHWWPNGPLQPPFCWPFQCSWLYSCSSSFFLFSKKKKKKNFSANSAECNEFGLVNV